MGSGMIMLVAIVGHTFCYTRDDIWLDVHTVNTYVHILGMEIKVHKCDKIYVPLFIHNQSEIQSHML